MHICIYSPKFCETKLLQKALKQDFRLNFKILPDIYQKLLPSEAMHQRVLKCDISDITNHSTDIYSPFLGQ